MTADVNANDLVALLVEVAALILLGSWAWQATTSPAWLRVLAVAAVVGGAVLLWGLFAAPQATFDVLGLTIATKTLVLGGSIAAAFVLARTPLWPGIWATVVVVNTVLIYVGPFARAGHQ